jgi:hypothetical protein
MDVIKKSVDCVATSEITIPKKCLNIAIPVDGRSRSASLFAAKFFVLDPVTWTIRRDKQTSRFGLPNQFESPGR